MFSDVLMFSGLVIPLDKTFLITGTGTKYNIYTHPVEGGTLREENVPNRTNVNFNRNHYFCCSRNKNDLKRSANQITATAPTIRCEDASAKVSSIVVS
jgi:hypothetical protein